MANSKQWEYVVVEQHSTGAVYDRDWLNTYGENGWELVAISAPLYYFKRQVLENAPEYRKARSTVLPVAV